MFGSTIDYFLLRPLTHNRRLETEDALDARYAAGLGVDMPAAMRRFEKLQRRMDDRVPIRGDYSYLDIGCGSGDLALALAMLGAGKVTGLDLVSRHVVAAETNRDRLGLTRQVDFVCCDIHHWTPSERYDVVLSHEALEHIRDPRGFIHRLAAFVKDDGIAVLAFGPLFKSPFGDHMDGFFKFPIPWRGVLFSEPAILRLRRTRYRPSDPAGRYPEIVGGLNLLNYSDFLRDVAETGWTFQYLAVNPQLRRIPPAQWISNALVRTPVVRDYFASSVYCILTRRRTG